MGCDKEGKERGLKPVPNKKRLSQACASFFFASPDEETIAYALLTSCSASAKPRAPDV